MRDDLNAAFRSLTSSRAFTAVALIVSTAAKAFLFRLDATDPRAFTAAIATLALAALVASVIPARRAASVDPMVALRE